MRYQTLDTLCSGKIIGTLDLEGKHDLQECWTSLSDNHRPCLSFDMRYAKLFFQKNTICSLSSIICPFLVRRDPPDQVSESKVCEDY